MYEHIKKTLEALLIIISSAVLTNCKTQKQITETPVINPPTTQITREKIQKNEYKIFNIKNQEPYKAELRDYRILEKYINHVEQEYRIAIENPENFPEVLQIIDTNRNRIIER